MEKWTLISMNDAISHWSNNECTMHQLAPYIGKLRPSLVRELIQLYTSPSDTILDPFAGAGTVSVESLIYGRNAIANDINPYSITLINAKMFPPNSLDEALEKADYYLNRLETEKNKNYSISGIPEWVRCFFHPSTLIEIIILCKLFRENQEDFLLACLLGILHHQRIGFLSYPSSHLVPYLRTKNFPRNDFPDLYEYRDVGPRLINKIKRAFKRFSSYDPTLIRKCYCENAASLKLPDRSIDAIITSPPYMNTLDYGRDNRLRLWFLGVEDYRYLDKKNPSSISEYTSLLENTLNSLKYALKDGAICIFILGEDSRSASPIDTCSMLQKIALNKVGGFRIIRTVEDVIPNRKRTRKSGQRTKIEWINILQREN